MDAGTKLSMLRQLEILAESSEYFKPDGQLGQTHHLNGEKPRWFCLHDELRKPFEDDKVLYDFIEPGTPVQEVAKRHRPGRVHRCGSLARTGVFSFLSPLPGRGP